MTRTTGVVILWAVVVLGGGCGTDDAEPTTAQLKVSDPQPLSNLRTVHASLSFGEEHVLQFVEFKPGLVGVVEKGRNVLDVPKATPELKSLAWLDLYRHFAGNSASITKEMAAASVRASARAIAPTSIAPAEPGTESVGAGPHFYNSSEQTWFRNTFCNGARDCIQGFDWTRMQSYKPIDHGGAVGMVGSEGTTNATFQQYWYDCGWNFVYGTECWWLEFDSVVIVPGHWVGTTLSGGPNYIQWDLTGGGPSTQVSSASSY